MEMEEKCYKLMVEKSNNPKEDREYNDFIFDYYYQLRNCDFFKLSSPIRILWKITGNCNLNCKHCWANLYGKDVSDYEILKTAKELAESRVVAVSLSGGEPLLRFDLLVEIIKILKSKNIIVEILTNGTLLDDEKILALSKILNLNTDVIQISIDGANSKSHNNQRGKQYFEKVVQNIIKLRNANVKVRCSFTATNINCKEIFETYKLVNDLKVTTFSISPVFPLRKGEKMYLDLDQYEYLSQVLECKEHESENYTKLRIQVPMLFQYLVNSYMKSNNILKYKNDSHEIYYQPEGILSIQIDAIGNVIPGAEWNEEIYYGNIYKDGFYVINENLYKNELYLGRNFTKTKCDNCNLYKICYGGNSKCAYASYGNINSPDANCYIEDKDDE